MSIQNNSKGIDQLTEQQRSLLNEYLSATRIAGVVTGVIVAEQEWDLRPLVLENGQLDIIRFLAPERCADPVQVQEMVAVLQKIFSIDRDPLAMPAVSYVSSTVFFRRRYYPSTLADLIDPFTQHGPEISRASLVSVLSVLRDLYQAGLSHGHLTLANFTIQNDNIMLLDYCLQRIPSGLSDEDDLGALQQIFSLLRFKDLSPALVECLRKIGSGSESPLRRIEQLLDRCSLSSMPVRGEAIKTAAITPGIAGIKGKLIEVPSSSVVENAVVDKAQVKQKADVAKERIDSRQISGVNAHVSRWLTDLLGARGSRLAWAGLMVGFFGIAAILSDGFGVFSTKKPVKHYQQLLESNDRIVQLSVTEEALKNPFSSAMNAIQAFFLSGKTIPQSRAEMIRLAFDERWFADLSVADRKTLLSISLGELVPASERLVAPFSSLHAGVLLALSSSIALNSSAEMFSGITLERFLQLPEPLRTGFEIIRSRGIDDFRHQSVRAFCHLIIGESSPYLFDSYFVEKQNSAQMSQQLAVLVPFFAKFPSLAQGFERYISNAQLPLSGDYAWFVAESTAEWISAPLLARLEILAGTLPEKGLSLEQRIDLLQYPVATVRQLSREQLIKNTLSASYNSLLLVLASDENRLTREQTIFLVSALQLSGEDAFAFLSRWFSGEPDPDTVFLLLLSRSRISTSAPFDIEGARYLINRQWSASTEELAEVVHHPEALARALAYSRLDPKKAADLAMLRTQLTSDPSQRLREQIREKLQAAGIR